MRKRIRYKCDLDFYFCLFTFVPSLKTDLLHLYHSKMKERLSKIITSEGLTPSLLADELGVQRSGISHIMSGRNYPSFDFLQKLLQRFPKLNAEWLILGHGAMYKTTVADSPDLFAAPLAIPEKTSESPAVPEKLPDYSSREAPPKKNPEVAPKILPPAEAEKTIEKMMILYSDKTFVTYSPESSQ